MGEPRERPILFSGPMIRAIDAGTKTQTRRVVRNVGSVDTAHGEPYIVDSRANAKQPAACPFGVPGDRLWVRESLRRDDDYARWEYAADGLALQSDPALWSLRCEWTERVGDRRHVPSIHMPRWASRITLRVTSVRVERVQDISDEDARAEGVREYAKGRGIAAITSRSVVFGGTPRDVFGVLWDSINGRRAGCAWRDNPWVWAVGFEVERRA